VFIIKFVDDCYKMWLIERDDISRAIFTAKKQIWNKRCL